MTTLLFMKIKKPLFVAALCLGFITGCSNKSLISVDKSALQKIKIKSIYIVRFEGNPNFVDESTDFFVAKIRDLSQLKVIQGESVRAEGYDINSGSNIASQKEAFKAAEKNNADLLILGKVTSHHTDGMLNGFSTIRIFDTKTNQQIGSIHRPSGLLFAYSEHQTVIEAVERTAKDLAKILNEIQ